MHPILIGLGLSYLILAPITTQVSLDVTSTHWDDPVVYAALCVGALIWFGLFAGFKAIAGTMADALFLGTRAV